MNATLPYRANADLLEAKYLDWKQDARSVEPAWASFFEGFELGMAQMPRLSAVEGEDDSLPLSEKTLTFRTKVTNAILDFRRIGHTAAWLYPLSKRPPEQPLLTQAALGFSNEELEQEVTTHFHAQGKPIKLRIMLDELRRIYCDKLGFEIMHIHNREVRVWLRERIEARLDTPAPAPERQAEMLRWA